jgi:hypothetical protein
MSALAATPAVAAADWSGLVVREASDGSRWLTGCVSNERASRLINQAGFQAGAGPFYLLCLDGYSQVSKKLSR